MSPNSPRLLRPKSVLRASRRRRLSMELLEGRRLLAFGQASLVSVNQTGAEAGNSSSQVGDQTLSADGRYLVFASNATDLVPGDINNTTDVFLRDLRSGTVTLVSRAPSGQTANSTSSEPAISADGQYVVFSSAATNLSVTGPVSTNGQQQVYRWQRATGVTELLSVDLLGTQSANNSAGAASISGDGSRVAFQTSATNLGTGTPASSSGHYYALTSIGQTWTDAEAEAVASGGHLVSINNAFEQQFLLSTFGDGANLNSVNWIGLNDASVEGQFVWSTGEPLTFTNWGPGEPSDSNGNEDFVNIGTFGGNLWNDFDGAAPLFGIKEYNSLPVGVPGAVAIPGNNLAIDNNSALDVFLWDSATQLTTLVSRSAAAASQTANSDSYSPQISRDGSRVVYRSTATNLQIGASDVAGEDLVVFEVAAGSNQYVTVQTQAASTANVGSQRSRYSLSADGVYEVFTSTATDLVTGDTNVRSDVFLRNLNNGSITLVSRGANNQPANGGSVEGVISADGAFVTFLSDSTNLAVTGANSNNSIQQAYRWERATGIIRLVSVNAAGDNGSAFGVENLTISQDGTRIAFTSNSQDLLNAFVDGNGGSDVFVRDLVANTTTLVSRQAGQSLISANGTSADARISRDGSRVVYRSIASDLQSGVNDFNNRDDLIIFTLATAANQYLTVETSTTTTANQSSARTGQSLSADGRYEVFESAASNLVVGDSNNTTDIFLRDLQTDTITLVSRATTGSANSQSIMPVISDDGAFVAFLSSAQNLDVTGVNATDGFSQVYRWRRSNGQLELASRNFDGSNGQAGHVESLSISGDGSRIAFITAATDVVTALTDNNFDADVFLRNFTLGTTTLVSHASDLLTTTGNGRSDTAKISRDGTRIVYRSSASNLDVAAIDNNNFNDLIAYNVGTNTNGYVTTEIETGGTANAASTRSISSLELNVQTISSDGRYEVFTTVANDVVAGDTNQAFDVFLRDSVANTVTLVSRAAALATANSSSYDPAISANGNFVVFTSSATNLDVTGVQSTNGADQVYRWERATGTIRLASVNSAGTDGGNASSRHGNVSGDGAIVVYESNASDHLAGITDGNSDSDVYSRSFSGNVTRLVSRSSASATTTANGGSFGAMVSRDGSTVGFHSNASNLVTGVSDTNNQIDLFAFNTSTLLNRAVSVAASGTTMSNAGVFADVFDGLHGVSAFSLSNNGQQIAFSSIGTNINVAASSGNVQVFVRDLATNTTDFVSVDNGGFAGNQSSLHPSISGDGRYVAFESAANNFSVIDLNFASDIYVRDRATGVRTTTLISVNSTGTAEGDGQSIYPRISNDGSTVAFQTLATDLDTGTLPRLTNDLNNTWDVVSRRWQGASPVTQWISKRGIDATSSGNDASQLPELSDNGSVVIYISNASDIDSSITDINGRNTDIFRFNGASTSTVSRKGAGRFTLNTGANSDFDLSSSGQSIAFTSSSPGLIVGDVLDNTGLPTQVYVRDVVANSTLRVSRDADSAYANNSSVEPSISGNGSRIAFISHSNDLTVVPLATTPNIYVRDLTLSTTELVSINSSSTASGDSGSYSPRISFNGNAIAYESYASDLDSTITADSNGGRDIFIRSAGLTRLVSRQGGTNLAANGESFAPEISDTGSRIVFTSNSTNLSATVADINGAADDIFAFDGTNVSVVSRKAAGAFTVLGGFDGSYDLSDSGQFVVFDSQAIGLLPNGSPSTRQAYLRDLSGGLQRISADADSIFGDGSSSQATISGDGRYVAFRSDASNLSTLPTFGVSNVYARDRLAANPQLISVDSTGASGADSYTESPVISNDGFMVGFLSFATNLDASVTVDTNQTVDLFTRDWLATTPITKLISKRGGTTNIASTGGVSYFGQLGRDVFELSSTGSRVVFRSPSTDLVAGVADVNGAAEDLFAFNGTTVAIVSAKASGIFTTGSAGDTFVGGDSRFSISDTGNQIAYSSDAIGIVADPAGVFARQVYVRDLQSASTRRISTPGETVPNGFTFTDNFTAGPSSQWGNEIGNWVASGGTYSPTVPSNSPTTYSSLPFQLEDFTLDLDINQVTDGGVWLRSQNNTQGVLLVTKDGELYWHIVQGGFSGIISPSGIVYTPLSNIHLRVVVSGNTYAAFVNGSSTPATTLTTGAFVSGRVALYGFSTQTFDNINLLATTSVPAPNFGFNTSAGATISGDGRYVSYVSSATNLTSDSLQGHPAVFAYDRIGNRTTLISVSSTIGLNANSSSVYQTISHDGNAIAFGSYATDLDPTANANFSLQLYIRDWLASAPATQLVSRSGTSTNASNADISSVRLSDRALTAAFTSTATDLTGIADNNSTTDVFVVRGLGLIINSLSIVEGNSGTTNAVFEVELLTRSSQTVTANFATSNGTATAGSDYLAQSGTLTYSPNQNLKTISVVINADTTPEDFETFFVNLSNPTLGFELFTPIGQGIIVNDDTSVSVADVSIIEGNAGQSNLVFSVLLAKPTVLPVSMNFATSNLTATAGIDYLATTGALAFAPGETSKTVSVVINGDMTPEAHETFRLTLSSVVNAAVVDGIADGTILNDDTTISIGDASIIEGDSGTQNASLVVSLSHASALPVSINLATGTGTATLNTDYTIVGPVVITFNPGETSKPYVISVVGDTVVEPNETVVVNLSSPTNAAINDGQGVLTILNDDTQISINDVSMLEGDSGTKLFTFTVSLSAASAKTVTVQAQSANGTATAGADYIALALTTLTFNPGEIAKSVSITVNGDLVIEPNETFFVNLTNPTNATFFDNQGLGTIQTDDFDLVPPTVTAVYAAGSAWTAALIDAVDGGGTGAGNGLGYQLTPNFTIPNSGINRIYVQFSEPVMGFSAASFALVGVNVANYAGFSSVSYDSVNRRGIIALSNVITNDKFRVGVNSTVTDTAGNLLDGDMIGGAGGVFSLRFNVLVGDANGDGTVNGGDLSGFAGSFNQNAGSSTFNPRADWNSDGTVNGADLSSFAARFNQSLPASEPTSVLFSGLGTVPGVFAAPAVDAYFQKIGEREKLSLLDDPTLF